MMKHFPVTSSVLSAVELGVFLRQNYSLGEKATCDLLKTFVNDTYLIIDDSTKYVFRIYSFGWRTEIEVSEEIRLINVLREDNIGLSYAIADLKGKYIQKLPAPEGERMGVLFSFAVGEKSFNPSVEANFKIGEMMARIHQRTLNLKLQRIDYDAEALVVKSFEKFKSYLVVDSDEIKFMLGAQQYLLNAFESADLSKIRQGAVHLDIWADNLHVDPNNNITLFDFDFCGNGWLCYDIAFNFIMLFSMEGNEVEYRKKVESFLKGYESILVISDEEKRMLPAAAASICFYYLGVQRERFASVFFNEEHLKRFVNFRIKKWMVFNGLNMQSPT
jgi:Ser/Thr protein kinase RdoA (MazF antagonist)